MPTLLLFVVAVLLYAFGLTLPATLLVVLGMLAEGIFWFRLFKGSRRRFRS